MKKILLIDGHSILNRAFYGVPPLTNFEGIHTNAVYGFINIMLKSLEDEHADYIAVAFDLKAPTFRHKMFAEYKGTRKPMPQELHEQVPIIKEVLSAMTIPVITLEGYEADDILGTLAKRCQRDGFEVSILSGDRDLLQLADEHIKIRMPKTVKGQTSIENYYPSDVIDKYQVTPEEFIDLKALMGDSSDNIPGVPGIGEKTATAIITKYKSIEAAYADVDNITPAKARNNLSEHYDMAVMSKKLATINIDSPVDFDVEDAYIDNLFTAGAYEIFSRLELKSLLKRFKDAEPVKEDDLSDKFCYINDYAKADDIIRECMNSECAGIRLAVCDDVLYGAALAFDDKYYYIGVEGFITQDYLADSIKALSQKIHLYAINLKAQVDYINPDINDDTDDLAIMQYLINPLKDAYTYAELAREYLNRNFASEEDILGKNTIAQESENVPDKLMQICCYDAYTALTAHDKIYDKLCSMGMKEVYHNIELPIIYVLRSMEHEGIRVNRTALKSYGDELAVKIEELRSGIYEQAGTEFNINSPKQLGEILFDRMGIEGGKKTKTGYSTSAEVLEKLAPDYPIVNDILEYRTLAKLKSTYADGLADYIRDDGRIHGTFNQTITATGRISSTEPNLQNIPIRMDIGRQIRKVFIPKDGYVFTDADYSQIELRLLAHMSGDETLINAYREDKDIHRITASKVFKTPLEEVTPRQRSNAKAVNFGIVYGISSFGLSKDLGISRKEAKEYIDEYFKTYPSIKDYLNGLVDNARKDGYSITLYGRRRPVPELASSNFMQRQFGERIAMNSPLQGTAADIIKIAMINVYKRLGQSNLKSKLILQIHDELLIETAPGEEDEVKRILSEEMEGAAKLRVPLEIDIHSGNNWYEAK
ncbi:MAG: DNA polymerase I [Lachnospiraceae bacterium]|nr:DNA polymerase I [Lachnospiraceae bacterium]